MVTAELIVVVVVLAIVALVLGGRRAQRKHMERDKGAFAASLDALDSELAVARAADRGWDRITLESAAREAYAAERGPGAVELTLVRIIDQPGTDDDKAVFSAEPRAGASERITLGRRNGAWVLDALS